MGFGNSYSLGFGQEEPRGSREEVSLEEVLGKRCSGRGSREEVSLEEVLGKRFSGRGVSGRGVSGRRFHGKRCSAHKAP